MTRVTILDGGMGKELRRIGAPFRQPEWSSLALMKAPEKVIEAHRNFIEAGAQVVTTNNYAVVPYHHSIDFFAEHGPELVARAGRLARTAADESLHHVDVAGSMPPLFGSYEPSAFDHDRAVPIYSEIARALDPFVDIWLAETLSTIDEMETIVGAVERVGPPRPIWISFALPNEWGDEGIALRSRETIEQIVDAVSGLSRSITAVLFNCSLPEQTGPALDVLRRTLDQAGLDVRSGGYANAFPTKRSGTYKANEVIFERRIELTAERYADVAAGWVDGGATIVGGCCDMYPEHIAALAERFP